MKMKEKIIITKIENAGCFLCKPLVEDGMDLYTEFLASLNTHILKRLSHGNASYVPKVGDICACYTAVGDADQLWYRGLIKKVFKSPNGMIFEVFLVDEGEVSFITKARIRWLSEEFQEFHHQVLKCVLNNLVPMTLNCNEDLMMSMKKTNYWDKSATRYLESLVKGSELFIEHVAQDQDGTRHVVLYYEKNNTFQNINELLVSNKYATFQSHYLSNKSIVRPNVPEKAQVMTPPKDKIDAFKSLSPIEIFQQQQKQRQQRKEEKQQKINQKASKECEELLQLLQDPTTTPLNRVRPSGVRTEKKIVTESSGSEQSDIESTPLPFTSSYKSTTRTSGAEFLMDKLGQGNFSMLSKTLGIEYYTSEQTSRANNSFGATFKPFDPTDETQKEPQILSHLLDANFLLNAVSGGASIKKKQQAVFSNDDVLIYGKRKREPITSLDDMSLPDPLGVNLKMLNFKSLSPFQMHLWPAVAAFRNVVGIAETKSSDTSKIIGYIVPIIRNLILDGITYKELGSGNGPFVIICVSTWREAQLVFDICETLIGYCKKTIRLDIRYGGMDNEDQRNIRLLNGCEILVATIPSLNIAIQSNYTNLDRLCHLVFDNADKLVETFTEEIKYLMRSYCAVLKANDKLKTNQLIAVGRKWSYGIQSLLKSYFDREDSLVIISNKVEAAFFAKVPIAVEVCKSEDRLGYVLEFLNTDGANESSIVFTNSAKTAGDLEQQLILYGVSANVLTEFTPPQEVKDIRLSWNSAVSSKGMNVLITTDQAIKKVIFKNATFIVHYDFPKHKSEFGNRLMCLIKNIRENENAETPKELLSYVLVCEANDGIRNSTGLVKILKRSGQRIPPLLESIALSSRELKEETKQYSEICPRLKLFGDCRYLDDCMERHTIFPDKDLLGLCPTTGFVKVKILDVVSASCFWGRIIEHRLPFEGVTYDTSVYLTLGMDMNLHYGKDTLRRHCTRAEKYDICVIKTFQHGYQRVRIENVLEMEMERPKKLEVFGIDDGFTETVSFDELFICEEQFKTIPHQAVEIIACCVRPVEKGTSWTHEASFAMSSRIKGKVLEGRVKFSLQNTIWVDPLVEKELLEGMQTRTYTLDIARDLLNLKFAEKNIKHLENLRKLLYDVQGQTMEVRQTSGGLPVYMIDHEVSYLSDNDYEDVYVSAVVHPGLFYVQRTEQIDTLDKLDAKIDATMKVQKVDVDLKNTTLPVGYICAAKYSADEKWYRGKILGVNEDSCEYDIFFVDHGDRELVGKSKVVPAWPDIISLPFQAIECSFTNITPRVSEWRLYDGDEMWDICHEKLLVAKATAVGASEHIKDMISYEIELYDTSGNMNINISHQLVYIGVANGSIECIQEMFPHARKNQRYKNECDRCPDLCVDIHQEKESNEKIATARKIEEIFASVRQAPEVLIDNGSIQSICKLLALCNCDDVKEILLSALQVVTKTNDKCCDCVYNSNGLHIIYSIFQESTAVHLQIASLQTLKTFATDVWYQGTLVECRMIKTLLTSINKSKDEQLTSLMVEFLGLLCKENDTSCTSIRQEDGIEVLCKLLSDETSNKVLDACAKTFLVILKDNRNKERARECGGLQELAFICTKRMSDMTLLNFLKVLHTCIEGSELNREYLHRITAHLKLKNHASLPIRYSMPVRKLFKDLINLITPGPMANFISSYEIDPSFYETKQKKEIKAQQQQHQKKKKDKSKKQKPMTYWSQQKETITLSIDLRGVEAYESKIARDRVFFRTLHNDVEYELDVELFDEINENEYRLLVKGGEVLLVLLKVDVQQEWPRLLKSEKKFPNIRVDFDRWTDDKIPEYYFNEYYNDNADGAMPFQPNLPKPPICKPYTNAMPLPLDGSEDDSGDEEDEEDSADDYYYQQEYSNDYFQI